MQENEKPLEYKCSCDGKSCVGTCNGERAKPTFKDWLAFVILSVGMLLVIVWLTSKNDEENLNTKKENPPIMFKENIDKINF